MDYRIENKDAFTVIAKSRIFPYEGAENTIPSFWQEHQMSSSAQTVRGIYGINHDENMSGDTFEYLIADPCAPGAKAPYGYEIRTIPAFTWAVFPIRGAMPDALQNVNSRIFSEWLPGLKEYEFAAGYCVEYYDDPQKYAKGTQDADYYCEIWIPIRQK